MLKALFNRRFWLSWIFLFGVTWAYHMYAPASTRNAVATIFGKYEETFFKPILENQDVPADVKEAAKIIRNQLENLIKEPTSKSTPEEVRKINDEHIDPVLNDNNAPETFKAQLGQLREQLASVVAESQKEFSVTVLVNWGVATAIIAVALTGLLPGRAGAQVSRDVQAAQRAVTNSDELALVVTHYKEFALRAAQGRCMVVYALGSYAGAVFAPLNTATIQINREGILHQDVILHLVAMSMAALCAAAWSSQQPSQYLRDYPGFLLSLKIGFGGVFLAGLIALAIGLPYLMANSASSAILNQPPILAVIVLRLALLPLCGWLGALVCCVLTRWMCGR
jgi:hypothetical protein